ncbi:MAG: PQQ-binding-like beta-propeller repeat protein, partial [Myxococcota bacterium]
CQCTQPAETYCSKINACVHLQTNSKYCGTCEKSCAQGEKCTGGQCVCNACRWFHTGHVERRHLVKVAFSHKQEVWTILVFEGALSWNSISLASASGIRVMLAKHDTEGRILWHKVFLCTGKRCALSDAFITVDRYDQSYIALNIESGAIDLHTPRTAAQKTKASLTGRGTLLAKFDPNGELLWIKVIQSPKIVQLSDMTLAPQNNTLVLAGIFEQSLQTDDLRFQLDQRSGGFLIALDTQTGSTKWSHIVQANVIGSINIGATDRGYVLLGFNYRGKMFLNQQEKDASNESTRTKGALTCWNTQGQLLWEHQIDPGGSQGMIQVFDLIGVGRDHIVVHITTSRNIVIGARTVTRGDVVLVNALLGFSADGTWLWTRYYGTPRSSVVTVSSLRAYDQSRFLVHLQNDGSILYGDQKLPNHQTHQSNWMWFLQVDAATGVARQLFSRDFPITYFNNLDFQTQPAQRVHT